MYNFSLPFVFFRFKTCAYLNFITPVIFRQSASSKRVPCSSDNIQKPLIAGGMRLSLSYKVCLNMRFDWEYIDIAFSVLLNELDEYNKKID